MFVCEGKSKSCGGMFYFSRKFSEKPQAEVEQLRNYTAFVWRIITELTHVVLFMCYSWYISLTYKKIYFALK